MLKLLQITCHIFFFAYLTSRRENVSKTKKSGQEHNPYCLKISTSMLDNNTENLEPYMITRKVPHGNT
jgi:hypothetical protein